MNRITEFYESNHLLLFTILIIATVLTIFRNSQKIKKLISKVGEMKVKIAEYEKMRTDNFSKSIKVGSIITLKYILTGEEITLQIVENQSGKMDNQSEIRRINSILPLAVSLLDKEVGDIVKFKLNITDEKEIYVEVLNIGVNFEQDSEELMDENVVFCTEIISETPIDNIKSNEFGPLKKELHHKTYPRDMSDGFRRWLSRGNNKKGKNYKEGTVIAYANAINTLSVHYSKHQNKVNIYSLDGQFIEELKKINELYGMSGRYKDFGDTAHGTYRNAIAAYVRFISSLNRN